MADPAPHLCLTVDVDPAVEPIGGHVVDGDERTPFRGWLQLLSVIEVLRLRGASTPPREGNPS